MTFKKYLRKVDLVTFKDLFPCAAGVAVVPLSDDVVAVGVYLGGAPVEVCGLVGAGAVGHAVPVGEGEDAARPVQRRAAGLVVSYLAL